MKVLCILACVLGAALAADVQPRGFGSNLLHRSETALKLVNNAFTALADQVKNSNLSPAEELLQKKYSLVSFFFLELLQNYPYTPETYTRLYDRILRTLDENKQLPSFELAQPALHLFAEFLVHTRKRSQALQKYCYLYQSKSGTPVTNDTGVNFCRRVLQKYDDYKQALYQDHKRAARLHDSVLDNVYLFEKFGNLLLEVKDLDYEKVVPFLKRVKNQVRKAVERLSYAFENLEVANKRPSALNLGNCFDPHAPVLPSVYPALHVDPYSTDNNKTLHEY